MPEYVTHKYLNFSRPLGDDVIGQTLGPGLNGRRWTIVAVDPRTDGKPGSFVTVSPVLTFGAPQPDGTVRVVHATDRVTGENGQLLVDRSGRFRRG